MMSRETRAVVADSLSQTQGGRAHHASCPLLFYNSLDFSNHINYNDAKAVIYRYDAEGNLVSEYKRDTTASNRALTTTYTYDGLNRVISAHEEAVGHNTTRTYLYDTLGNLIREEQDGCVEYKYNGFALDESKKCGTIPNSIGTSYWEYTYDGRGNLVSNDKYTRTTSGMAWQNEETYVYDETNHMVDAKNEQGEHSLYTYNGLGLRVGRELIMQDNTHGYTDFHDETPSVETGLNKPEVAVESYVIDYTSPTFRTLTMEEEGGFDYRWVYGLDKLSVKITSEGTNWWGQNVKQDILKDYLHQDRLGNTTNLTDKFGRVVGRADYNEWGEITYKDALDITSAYRRIYPQLNYTGHDWDDVLEMYYAKARFYDPDAKRFVELDPVKGQVTDPLSLVSYLYCVDNPLRWVDPNGEIAIKVADYIRYKQAQMQSIADVRVAWDVTHAKDNKDKVLRFYYYGKHVDFKPLGVDNVKNGGIFELRNRNNVVTDNNGFFYVDDVTLTERLQASDAFGKNFKRPWSKKVTLDWLNNMDKTSRIVLASSLESGWEQYKKFKEEWENADVGQQLSLLFSAAIGNGILGFMDDIMDYNERMDLFEFMINAIDDIDISENMIEDIRNGKKSVSVGSFFEKISKKFFNFNEKMGFWYSPNNTWQRTSGYNDLYDEIFEIGEALGISPNRKFKSVFEYNGKRWRIEGWMGNYAQLGVGAEIGVYYQDLKCDNEHFKSVEDGDMLNIEWTLHKKGGYGFDEVIMKREELKTWWLNGFRPDSDVVPKDKLWLEASIEFKSAKMADAFIKGLVYGTESLSYSFSEVVQNLANQIGTIKGDNLNTIVFDNKDQISFKPSPNTIAQKARYEREAKSFKVDITWGK